MMTSPRGDVSIIRKLFAYELQFLTFDRTRNRYELRIDGRRFELRLIWLQGYLTQSDDDVLDPRLAAVLGDDHPCDIWLFKDRSTSTTSSSSSFQIPIVISQSIRANLKKPINADSYYSIVAALHLPDVSSRNHRRDGSMDEKIDCVKLKAKRLIDLNSRPSNVGDGDEATSAIPTTVEEITKNNELIDEVWSLEVLHYHRMITDSDYSED